MAVTSLLNPKAHMSRTLALVLAGGRGLRLHGLSEERAKPAVPFGGKYRLIDFALSNCLNSGVGKVGVITQYQPNSLHHHLDQAWGMNSGDGAQPVQLLPAERHGHDFNGYAGTADAIFQNMDIVRSQDPEYVLVLAGDHVYKMDYTPLIESHVVSGADMTISAIETSVKDGKQFGVLSVNDEGRVVRFTEKPSEPEPIPGSNDRCLSSMGIYVFNAKYLANVLAAENITQLGDDFGSDIIPELIRKHRVMAYAFNGHRQVSSYWRDVGTIDAFWQANIELIGAEPALDLYDKSWPIQTLPTQTPPAKFVYDSAEICGAAVNSLICEGCVVMGALVKNSVMCTNVVANEQTHIVDSVILPDCTIGKNCSLRRVVLDRHCVVPDGMVIGYDLAEDARRFKVSESDVVLVTQSMLDALQQYEPRKAA